MSEVFFIFISLLLIGLCGIFVAAEFAFITVNRSTAERHAERGDRKAKGVVVALHTLSTQLSGAQVGITITNLAIGFLAEPSIAQLLRHPLEQAGLEGSLVHVIAAVIGITIATIFTMVFGELVPKNLAISKPLATAKAVQGIQRNFSKLMWYPIKGLNGSANFVIRLLGLEPQEELASARSADELTSLVRRSAEKGTLPKDTARMIERSLAFGDLVATDVMTPRIRVKTVSVDNTASDVIQLARSSGLSRFPVVKTNLDDVTGLVHVKHAVAVAETERDKTLVSSIMRPAITVPSSIQLEPLLEMLKNGGLQMAIVIDEFGGADGIVTIEDLIEELVGEVHDEHDRSHAAIRTQSANTWIISGLLRPDEVGQELGIFLPESEEVETVGGLVTARLEHVPQAGDQVDITAIDRDGNDKIATLEVIRMDGRRIDRLRMTDKNPTPSAEQGQS
jgi:CBS domain containing-hemolysin-like protein